VDWTEYFRKRWTGFFRKIPGRGWIKRDISGNKPKKDKSGPENAYFTDSVAFLLFFSMLRRLSRKDGKLIKWETRDCERY
jgi:hypothetical protein